MILLERLGTTKYRDILYNNIVLIHKADSIPGLAIFNKTEYGYMPESDKIGMLYQGSVVNKALKFLQKPSVHILNTYKVHDYKDLDGFNPFGIEHKPIQVGNNIWAFISMYEDAYCLAYTCNRIYFNLFSDGVFSNLNIDTYDNSIGNKYIISASNLFSNNKNLDTSKILRNTRTDRILTTEAFYNTCDYSILGTNKKSMIINNIDSSYDTNKRINIISEALHSNYIIKNFDISKDKIKIDHTEIKLKSEKSIVHIVNDSSYKELSYEESDDEVTIIFPRVPVVFYRFSCDIENIQCSGMIVCGEYNINNGFIRKGIVELI